MLAQQWTYAEEIPGSRCGPEDGPWPRNYKVLDDEEIWKELKAAARPQSYSLKQGRKVDTLNFQPSPRTRTQDRYAIREFQVGGELWTVTGVFDGHLGDVTVEHVAHHLPIVLEEALQKAYATKRHSLSDPSFISALLSTSILAFDEAMASDVLDLFGGLEGLSKRSDAEIRRIINDQHLGGENFRKTRLNMYGTTAIIALTDPKHDNLWVASVGDCQAVLVTQRDSGAWDSRNLTAQHNGYNHTEINRVRSEHPEESECVINGRVLGALAPFRCLGDTAFKQPPEFTRRIFYNLLPGFHDVSPWEEFLRRNKTPPYISAEPEVVHCSLSQPSRTQYLILASDGLSDLCDAEAMSVRWAEQGDSERNMALRLLRLALGGDDRHTVSKVLTLDMPEMSWVDDTSIIVQTL